MQFNFSTLMISNDKKKQKQKNISSGIEFETVTDLKV